MDQAQEGVAAARDDLKAVEDGWAASQGDLAGEKHDLEERLGVLESEREEIVAGVDPDTLRAYEALRAQKGGLAVATIKDGVCTACGVAPTSSVLQKARHGELDARCPTCGRILFAG